MKKKINLCFVGLFLAILFVFSAAFVISPDREYSEEENRPLAQAPEFTFDRLADGSFTSDTNTYFSDQFWLRDQMVGIKGVSETLFLKRQNNGVLLGKDGQLAVRFFDMYKSRLEITPDMDNFYEENVKLSIDKYNQFCENEERPLITLMPPRTIDVGASAFDYPDYLSRALQNKVSTHLSEKSGYINLLPDLKKAYDSGEYVYYRTDHHWTMRGAHMAYSKVLEKWGMGKKVIPLKNFEKEEIPSFYGTTWSRAGMKFVGSDTMEIFSLGNEDEFVTECYKATRKKTDSGYKNQFVSYKKFSGFIERSHLETKNKYAAFLDGTHNIVTVTKKTTEKREKLLLVKDSFADCMVPFLAQHFDITVINLANNISDVSEYAQEFQCDRILVVYNFENLLENTNLANIK